MKEFTIKAGSTNIEMVRKIEDIISGNYPNAYLRERKSGAIIAFIHFNEVFLYTKNWQDSIK